MTDFHFLANLLFPCSQDNYKGLYAGNITHECSKFGPTMHWRVFYSQTLKATPLNPPPPSTWRFPSQNASANSGDYSRYTGYS